MTFEEIFKEDGLYVADSFAEGVCFQIENGHLYIYEYTSKDDLFPTQIQLTVHKHLFNKDYKKVLTRQSLFK